MPKKLCIDCGKRQVMGGPSGNPESNLCEPCLDYALEENRHSDDGHEIPGRFDETCPVCRGENPADGEVTTGHTNGVPLSHTSHAECGHPRTKSARAACRRRRNKS